MNDAIAIKILLSLASDLRERNYSVDTTDLTNPYNGDFVRLWIKAVAKLPFWLRLLTGEKYIEYVIGIQDNLLKIVSRQQALGQIDISDPRSFDSLDKIIKNVKNACFPIVRKFGNFKHSLTIEIHRKKCNCLNCDKIFIKTSLHVNPFMKKKLLVDDMINHFRGPLVFKFWRIYIRYYRTW